MRPNPAPQSSPAFLQLLPEPAFFDCLYDMGDPVGAARHVRRALAPDGTWMILEPSANDNVAANLNAVGAFTTQPRQ